MRVLLVTDAWYPQINGVVRTLDTLKRMLEALGHEVVYVTPEGFRCIPCPTYPSIQLALRPGRRMAEVIEGFRPCAVHIATEGPLGVAARRYCGRRGVPFTTAFHTKFPEYVNARFKVPVGWGYKAMKWFHGPSRCVMVATQTIEDELIAWGLGNIRRWTRGVDVALFRPRGPEERPPELRDVTGPVFLYVGRIAVEKSIEDFLKLDLPGTKAVVGEGPQEAELRKRYPDALFPGPRHGEDLARWYAAADCFVFPSRTDTFGLVLIEALAAGTPVAAYPVAGPLDVIGDASVGRLSENLRQACLEALEVPRADARAFAMDYSWDKSVAQFLDNIHVFEPNAFWPGSATPADRPRAAE